MTEFSDPEHSLLEIVFQGVHEEPIAALCDDTVVAALHDWEQRADKSDPMGDHFQFDNTRSFTISYQGRTGNYWPDEHANALGETMIRENLFSDGICTLKDLTPTLYVVKYKVQAIFDTEYLLVCPYPTHADNIAGLLVVCVNRLLKKRT